jgi:hypothetical protein
LFAVHVVAAAAAVLLLLHQDLMAPLPPIQVPALPSSYQQQHC